MYIHVVPHNVKRHYFKEDNTMIEKTENLVEAIVKGIVNDQSKVSITNEEKEGFRVVQIKVAQEDMGRVIGHAGSRIKALRLLASASAAMENIKVRVTLVE